VHFWGLTRRAGEFHFAFAPGFGLDNRPGLLWDPCDSQRPQKNRIAHVMLSCDKTFAQTLTCALALCVILGLSVSRAAAEAQILVDVETGKVLHAENATMPWYPASITKIMTTYATLRAVKEGRITLDKLLTVSPNALAQSPLRWGSRWARPLRSTTRSRYCW
jgi:D-alanyl-D-alanine carboxypeptidase